MNGITALHPEFPSALAAPHWWRRAVVRPLERVVTAPDPGADYGALILAIAQRGDRAAFAALFRHFAPRLKSYLMRAGAPAASAEELAQEALLSVWRKAGYFDPAKAGAAAWIFSIARNLRIDALRRQGRAARIEPDPSDEPEAAPGADSLLGLAEREVRVRAALVTLSAEQRRVIELAFFEDKPHSAIAQELGIPLGTVKSRLRLAMGRLRGLLDDVA